jgi:hypothetical protein
VARSFSAILSQSITVPSAASINFGTSDFTVMAWVRFPEEPPNGAMVVGKRAGGFDGDEGWELKINDGGNESYRWDVETDVTGRQRAEGTLTGINDGNWHLIGGDHTDGTPAQLQLWYDGAVAGTKVANTPGTVNTATPLVIGAAYNTPYTNFLTGEIGPVFAFNRVLTLAEHQMLAAGFSPRFLRPLPVFLLELISRASPEPDIAGGLYGTLANDPDAVFNPRMVLPRSPSVGQDLWYEFANATIAGQSSVAATVTRGRTAQTTIVGQSSVTAVASAVVPISAAIAGQSSLTADINPDAPLEAQVSGQSGVTATVNITAAVGANPRGQSNIVAVATATVPVAATIAGQSSISADINPAASVDATVAGQSAMTATAKRGRTISATVGGQSTVSAAVTISAGASAQISAQSGLSAFLSATVPISSTAAAAGGIVADPTALVPAAATIAGASGVIATVTRAQSVDTTITATSALVVDARALVPVATTIAGTSGLSVAASADVSASATITGQSDLSARLTFPGVKRTTSVGGLARWLITVGGRINR